MRTAFPQARLLVPPRLDDFCPAQACGRSCNAADCTCKRCWCSSCRSRSARAAKRSLTPAPFARINPQPRLFASPLPERSIIR